MLLNEITLKGAELLEKWGEEKSAEIVRAMGIALKKTAHETMKMMREDLKQDRLGLKPTSIYRGQTYQRINYGTQYGPAVRYEKRRYNWAKKRAPLRNLFPGITYQVVAKDPETKAYKYDAIASIGFGLRSMKTMWHEKWAGEHLAGYIWRYTRSYVQWLHTMGIHLSERVQGTGAQVFSRDIIGAFYSKRNRWMMDTLKKYFELKKTGKIWK